METTNELDVANNVNNHRLTELEEDIKELVDIFKEPNINMKKKTTYSIGTSLIRIKCKN